MSDFLNSPDIKFNLYCIYIMKKFLLIKESNQDLINIIINQIDYKFLLSMTYLLNKNNKKLSYDTLYILINLSYVDNGEQIFFDEQIILNIATFLGNNKNDPTLLNSGIWLIKNITFDNSQPNKATEYFLHFKIINFFEEIYERNLLNNNFMCNLMSCLWNFINYKFKTSKDVLNLIPSIKIIKTQLRPNLQPDLLNKYVYTLFTLTLYKSIDIFYEMCNCKIHKELMNIYPVCIENIDNLNFKINENGSKIDYENENYKKNVKTIEIYKNICLMILKVLGKLMCLEDGILTQTLIDSGIAKFLNVVLQSHDIRVIKNACFCISNICAGTCGQISNLYDNNTLFELTKVSKNIYDALEYNGKFKNEYFNELKDAFREINFVYSLTILNSIYDKLVPFIKYDNYIILLILLKGLEIFDERNEDLLELILESINKLIIFDQTDKYNDMNDNLSLVQFLEKYGLKEILEKIKSYKNINLLERAAKIYDSLFSDLDSKDI